MRVGLPYLAIGVCAMVAAWRVMNWLVQRGQVVRGSVNA